MAYREFMNWFSTTPVGSRIARHLAARIDPWLYRVSGGRITTTGVPTIPQLVLTTIGRKSGQPRSVQLGCLAYDGDWFVVASNFGQARHPAWAHNLLGNPNASVHSGREEVAVRAEKVSDDEKAALWPRLVAVIPQFNAYVQRTDRNIMVFRLRRLAQPSDRR